MDFIYAYEIETKKPFVTALSGAGMGRGGEMVGVI
jgi:hypothetical protein